MELWISNASGIPIYEQIVTQIKGRILAGDLAEGDILPSMRVLARELRISVITTKRAYEELEREGFIATVPGKGSYVAAVDVDLVREQRLREIEDLLRQAVEKAAACGLPESDLAEMLALAQQEV